MDWIYLSPHFDDVALSCGGLVWEQTQAGKQVGIWTICGGVPPRRELSPFARGLHTRWETGVEAVRQRQAEDVASCRALGASWRHFPIPDCIYRPRDKRIPHYYASEESLWGQLHPNEARYLVRRLGDLLKREIPDETQVVCPLTLGEHVDHLLTRKAAERGCSALWYYADYPYVLKSAVKLEGYRRQGWEWVPFSVSEAGVRAWMEAVAAHASQVSTFWPSSEVMRLAIGEYASGGAGLWRRDVSGLI